MPCVSIKFVQGVIADPKLTSVAEGEQRHAAIIHPRPVAMVLPSRQPQARNAAARAHPYRAIRSNANIDHIAVGQPLAFCKAMPLPACISKRRAGRRADPHAVFCKADHLHAVGGQAVRGREPVPVAPMIPLKPGRARAKPHRAIRAARHRQHGHIGQSVHGGNGFQNARIHIQQVHALHAV